MNSKGGGLEQQVKADFRPLWVLLGLVLISLAAYIFASYYYDSQIRFVVDEPKRIFIRSVLYVLAIITFPLTNLIRYVMVRLNQTMPGESTVRQRYFGTLLVSMGLASTIGIYGFIMFILGDSYNTLYIFCSLAALAVYLYRPKIAEYHSIVEALAENKT